MSRRWSVPFPMLCIGLVCVVFGLAAYQAGSWHFSRPKEKILINARTEWEDSCAKCGRRNGEPGVANNYCHNCNYAFKLLYFEQPAWGRGKVRPITDVTR